MQKLILSVLVGLFAPGLTRPPESVAGPQAGREALRAALSAPPVSAAEAARKRAAVRHEQSVVEGGRGHRFVFPDGEVVEFSDRTKRMHDQANREWVVMHIGTQSAADEPGATFAAAGRAAGLTPQAIEALQYVSRHEGGFDAINTWDRARFSWGFIQFAGGRGFPAALSHFKSTSPALFRKLLGDYGVDILPVANGRAQPVYVDPVSGAVVRGAPAEQAYGDNPLVVALFIRAGRVPEVKQRQVEAAIRDYAVPAMQDTFREIRVSEVLGSQQATAMLIDRKVHEGQVTRLSAALEHASIIANRRDPAGWPEMEGLVLDLAVRDSDARTNIAELAAAAAAELERAAEQGAAGGASLESARRLLEKALYEADYRMVVGYRRDGLHNGLAGAISGLAPDRIHSPDTEVATGTLRRSAAAVRELVSGLRFEYAVRNRLRGIRTSELPGPPREALEYP